MRVTDIEDRLEYLKTLERDVEVQHGAVDNLYADVLRAIANGEEWPAELARTALSAEEIVKVRWYA